MGLTRQQLFRAADLASPDHLPTCGRCGDLNEVGDERCRGCNGRLYPPGVKAPRMVAVEPPPPVPKMHKWWLDRHTEDELRELGGWAS